MTSKTTVLLLAIAVLVGAAIAAAPAAKPTCCDKHAYCCTIKARCGGKSLVVEVAALATNEEKGAKDETGKPICCAKRAYCCTIKATCCGKTSTENFTTKELDQDTLAVFAKDRDASLPICCVKKAYCCSIKSPCCGKELELEIVR